MLGIAVIAFVAWAALGPAPALSYALIAAVSVLIIACPYALGLVTPISIAVAIGKGAGADVLIKSTEALQRMKNVDTLLVDKTGTLTEGKLAGIARAIVLSRATMRNIRENLIFAFAYIAIGVPIAAGALYPGFGVLLSPNIGASAVSLSSVSVIANALRLRGLKL